MGLLPALGAPITCTARREHSLDLVLVNGYAVTQATLQFALVLANARVSTVTLTVTCQVASSYIIHLMTTSPRDDDDVSVGDVTE